MLRSTFVKRRCSGFARESTSETPHRGCNALRSNNTRMEEKSYTLIFCRRKNSTGLKEVLLGMKKRGFGTGKWNGFGGKIELGETAEQGAIRELEEESGLVVSAENMLRRGYLVFNMKESKKIMKVHVYEAWNWNGEEAESDEMRPQWWREDSIPFELTWKDDKFWLPLLLESKSFTGRSVLCSHLSRAVIKVPNHIL
jgi:8-oxo-dGTP pyrophosphatase MutT (NUDIX family)